MEWSRDLRAAGRGLRTALRAASAMLQPPVVSARPDAVRRIADFGANPGNLTMLAYTPAGLPRRAPLVVLLHGCGQEASTFAEAAGWIALADRVGLALVLPEQTGRNNHQRCFRWFRAAHTARERGEAGSIRAMVADAVCRFDSDPGGVFVVGLSAGAAMAVALLAAYPDVFAAGASVAGLPVGAANGTASALARMAQAGPTSRSAEVWATLARQHAPAGFRGPWPRLSIWHGGQDTVVDPANAALLARQWCALHGLETTAPEVEPGLLARQRVWRDASGPQVESWTLPVLAHGYPVAGAPPLANGVLTAGISATDHIARFWGL